MDAHALLGEGQQGDDPGPEHVRRLVLVGEGDEAVELVNGREAFTVVALEAEKVVPSERACRA